MPLASATFNTSYSFSVAPQGFPYAPGASCTFSLLGLPEAPGFTITLTPLALAVEPGAAAFVVYNGSAPGGAALVTWASASAVLPAPLTLVSGSGMSALTLAFVASSNMRGFRGALVQVAFAPSSASPTTSPSRTPSPSPTPLLQAGVGSAPPAPATLDICAAAGAGRSVDFAASNGTLLILVASAPANASAASCAFTVASAPPGSDLVATLLTWALPAGASLSLSSAYASARWVGFSGGTPALLAPEPPLALTLVLPGDRSTLPAGVFMSLTIEAVASASLAVVSASGQAALFVAAGAGSYALATPPAYAAIRVLGAGAGDSSNSSSMVRRSNSSLLGASNASSASLNASAGVPLASPLLAPAPLTRVTLQQPLASLFIAWAPFVSLVPGVPVASYTAVLGEGAGSASLGGCDGVPAAVRGCVVPLSPARALAHGSSLFATVTAWTAAGVGASVVAAPLLVDVTPPAAFAVAVAPTDLVLEPPFLRSPAPGLHCLTLSRG